MNLATENIWINLDKSKNISSALAVKIVKRITKAKKVGHGGTLDPFATGVLPIALNKATKQSSQIMDFRKKYYFRIVFGEFRDSDDITGNTTEKNSKRVSLNNFIANIAFFIGNIYQQPSKFSAIKINGVRSYDLVRAGKDFEITPRLIKIFSIKVLKYCEDYCDMEVECSKGTYIRSLARDICIKNKICGYVAILKRLEVGIFSINKTISLDDLKNIISFEASCKDGSVLTLK